MADGNRLAGEKSPYLLRHAGNPVDWYPWGDEAFVHAAEQDKPIFLSIGYSSCHWCHVMERDCFNDEEVAGLLNDACVSIKVDREERPDLDALFMEVCQAQNGSGGWPLSLFLTPQGEPFFAATFLPKRTAGKMPGMADVTPRVKWLWLMQRDDVLRGAKQLAKSIESGSSFSRGGHINSFHIKAAAKELKSIFDVRHGGFGPGPKFPCAPRLLFLLEYAKDAKNARLTPTEKEEFTRMVSLTLRKMWSGGIHDHIGGGYARYATDDRWVTPHFEKMLYDQAMLLWTAAAAYETEQDVFYQKFAEDVAGCILRDFTSPEACFWSSIDADSEGDEGKFYRWTEEEIRTLLPQGDAGIFCAAYAILPGGNFVHEMTGRQMGNNVLYEASTVPDLARRYGLRPADLAKRLENDRRVLFEARNKRVKPEIDDKILMDWNGFTIGALAYAGRVFEKKEWVLSGERAALFLQKVLVDPKGAWRRRYRAKEAAIPALPGDYAALMWGVMELYESSSADKQKKDWLKYAESLAVQLEENFGDGQTGGFFLSPASEEHIFLRRKSAVDDATPSANAMAMMAYAALERAAPQAKEAGKAEKYAEKAGAIGSCFSRPANANPVEHISIFTACMKLKNVKEEHPAVEVEDNKIEDKRIEDARTENKKAEDTRIEDRRGGSARHGRDTRSDLKRRR